MFSSVCSYPGHPPHQIHPKDVIVRAVPLVDVTSGGDLVRQFVEGIPGYFLARHLPRTGYRILEGPGLASSLLATDEA
jgi:hypothetical protein